LLSNNNLRKHFKAAKLGSLDVTVGSLGSLATAKIRQSAAKSPAAYAGLAASFATQNRWSIPS
jgi:hypothetical protein